MVRRCEGHVQVDEPGCQDGDGEAQDDDVRDPHELRVDQELAD